METKAIASQGGHWYEAKTGIPKYTITGANGKERNTTLRDAKKHGYVPSVTKICGLLDKPALNIWKLNTMLESAYTCPLKRDDVSSDEWCEEVVHEAQQQSEIARERGTEIHTAIEKYINDDSILTAHHKRCANFGQEMAQLDIRLGDISSEHSFATEKYGGKVDIWVPSLDCVLDIKTTEFEIIDGAPHKKGKKAKLHWPEMILQLAGYYMGLGDPLVPPMLGNVFISTITDDVYYHQWTYEDYTKANKQFKMLVDYWHLTNLGA